MSDRIPVVRVWLNRAEGPTREIGQRTVSSLADADSILHKWATSAPKEDQGYNKVDFRVEWADGNTYQGRFDMDQGHIKGTNLLGSQIQDHFLFLSGLRRPSHYAREVYDRYLAELGYEPGSDKRMDVLHALEAYEM